MWKTLSAKYESEKEFHQDIQNERMFFEWQIFLQKKICCFKLPSASARLRTIYTSCSFWMQKNSINLQKSCIRVVEKSCNRQEKEESVAEEYADRWFSACFIGNVGGNFSAIWIYTSRVNGTSYRGERWLNMWATERGFLELNHSPNNREGIRFSTRKFYQVASSIITLVTISRIFWNRGVDLSPLKRKKSPAKNNLSIV